MTFTPVHHTSYPFISPSKFINSLTGKIVLVTGASKGIGRAATLAFAATGASVAAVARGKEELETLISEIKEKYRVAAVGIVADLLVGMIDFSVYPSVLRFSFCLFGRGFGCCGSNP